MISLCLSALDDQTESMRAIGEQHQRTREAEERLGKEREIARQAQERVLGVKKREEEEKTTM